MGRIIPYIMENEKCLKPPLTVLFLHLSSHVRLLFPPARRYSPMALPNTHRPCSWAAPGVLIGALGQQPRPQGFNLLHGAMGIEDIWRYHALERCGLSMFISLFLGYPGYLSMFIPLFLGFQGFQHVSTIRLWWRRISQPSTDKMLMTCRRNEEILTTKYGDMQQDMGRWTTKLAIQSDINLYTPYKYIYIYSMYIYIYTSTAYTI